jgi:hypothetical protein
MTQVTANDPPNWLGNFGIHNGVSDAVLYTDFLPGPLAFFCDVSLRGQARKSR